MSASVSIAKWQRPARTPARPAPVPAPGRGLEPAVLLEEGILGDPTDPADAARRARGLVSQGLYRQARGLLTPHARTTGTVGRTIGELLAICAMRTGASEWERLLREALAAFVAAGDLLGEARTHQHLGEMHMAIGRLELADGHLRAAQVSYARAGEQSLGALIECVRASVRFRAGYIDRAFRRVERSLPAAIAGGARTEAFARLERARLLACQGEVALAAKDLVLAERTLGASGSVSDRVRVRLTRAEALLLGGDEARAANGLQKLLAEVADMEEVAVVAQGHALLGQALTELDPTGARRHLMRSRHLYDTIRHDYAVASSDIALARVEHRMGLNPRGRLASLTDDACREWPVVAARLQMARAELLAEENPERARLELYRARSFAIECGNRALAREIDRVLNQGPVTVSRDVEDLTPVDNTNSTSVSARVALKKARVAPQPLPLSLAEEAGCGVTERPDRTVAERLVRIDPPNKTGPALAPPRSVGPRPDRG